MVRSGDAFLLFLTNLRAQNVNGVLLHLNPKLELKAVATEESSAVGDSVGDNVVSIAESPGAPTGAVVMAVGGRYAGGRIVGGGCGGKTVVVGETEIVG